MATWTKIPETHIAYVLGKAVGALAGAVIPPIGKTLDKAEATIYEYQQLADGLQKEIRLVQDKAEQLILEKMSKSEMMSSGGGGFQSFLKENVAGTAATAATGVLVGKAADIAQEAAAQVSAKLKTFNTSSNTAIKALQATLTAASATLGTILTILATLKAMVITLRVPLPPFKVLIKIIKLLPIPQRWLIVSFTILESDLLEMLEQLIYQAEEEITGIERIIDSLEGMIKPIKDRIDRIRAMLNILTLSCAIATLSDDDRNLLEQAGFLDEETGDSLFNKIQDGLRGGGAFIGDDQALTYGLSDLTTEDLLKPAIANQLALANAGDVVTSTGKLNGSFLQTWYIRSIDQPDVPEGFTRNSGSWGLDRMPGSESLWKLDLKVSGDGTILKWVDPEPVLVEEGSLEDQFGEDIFSHFKLESGSYLVLDESNFDKKPGILKAGDWTDFMIKAVDKLMDLPISQDLRDTLSGLYTENVAEGQGTEKQPTPSKFQWISKNGEIFDIEVVEDSNSPSVAVRRFMRVRDAGGTVVLEGNKTFSTDIESLLHEIKMQLEELMR